MPTYAPHFSKNRVFISWVKERYIPSDPARWFLSSLQGFNSIFITSMGFPILKRTKSGQPLVDATWYVGNLCLSASSHLSCDGPIVSRCALMPFLRGEFDFECFMIIYGNQEQLRNEYACFILVAPSLLKTLVPAPTVCQLKLHAFSAKLGTLCCIFNITILRLFIKNLSPDSGISYDPSNLVNL